MLSDIEDKVRKIIIRESATAIGTPGGRLSADRAKLKKRYLGYGYSVDEDREKRSLSTYVDRTVMETVEWAMPGLMRVFAGGDEIIRFEPRTPAQEQAAADATLYVNQVVFGRSMFRLIHDTLKDGLYQRVGWCLAHAPREEHQTMERFTGLTVQEAQAMIADTEARGGMAEVEQYPDPSVPGGMACAVTVRTKTVTHDVRLDPVPSENVLISSEAEDVEHARFVAHWEIRTATQLMQEGYSRDVIDELPVYGSEDDPEEKSVGLGVNGDTSDTEETDAFENRRFKVYEAWLDVDLNGDGMAEKAKVVYVGDGSDTKVLSIEEWPLYRAPLFAACSVPMPHQVVGLCLADLVADVQDLRTDLTRSYLDALSFANSGELVVDYGPNQTGWADIDSLLARKPGALHRVRGGASITPLPVNSSANEAVQGLQLTDQLVERRSGVTSRTQSLDADTLQQTATGASIMEEAINQRLEMIARVYAEMFFKPLGRYVLNLLHRYHDKAVQVRLKGRFMDFDPRKWNPDMDISVAVGLGTGSRQKMLAAYQQILQIQQSFIEQLSTASPVRLSNVIYTCHKMVEAAGLEAPERFFGTEEDAKRAEQLILQQKQAGQGMDPLTAAKVQVEQVKAQTTRQKAAIDLQIQQAKLQQETQGKAVKVQTDAAAQAAKIQANAALKAQELNYEKQLDAVKLMQGGTAASLTNIREQSV
jgi:hypothetical protein